MKFYGPGDKVYGEFGPLEGVVFPADSRYWFESTGNEELELFQVFTFSDGQKNSRRINVDAHKELTLYEKDAK